MKERAERHTYWNETARTHGRDGIGELLTRFDRASMIVAYNGREFDMRVLARAYGNDKARRAAHMKKLHDPMVETQREAGRRVRLSTLLKLNGAGGKAGAGCDAPYLWQSGRHEQLERYCQRDAEALAELTAGYSP